MLKMKKTLIPWDASITDRNRASDGTSRSEDSLSLDNQLMSFSPFVRKLSTRRITGSWILRAPMEWFFRHLHVGSSASWNVAAQLCRCWPSYGLLFPEHQARLNWRMKVRRCYRRRPRRWYCVREPHQPANGYKRFPLPNSVYKCWLKSQGTTFKRSSTIDFLFQILFISAGLSLKEPLQQ
jgi:hypothetical protein